MALKVMRHGNRIAVTNPVTGRVREMINVTFIEEGRGAASSNMSASSDILSQIAGEEVGLEQLRIHTHPVLAEKIGLFPIHKDFGGDSSRELPGFINRTLSTTPQIELQRNVKPRMVDGQPTYFTTFIGNSPEDDVDKRVSNEAIMNSQPELLVNAQLRAANVELLEGVKPTGVGAVAATAQETVV